MRRCILLFISILAAACAYAQQDSVKADTVKVIAKDSAIARNAGQDSAVKASKLDVYLEAGREIIAPGSKSQDSVITSVIPGDSEKVAKIAKVALPAAAIIGSAVGLPFMGALAAAQKVATVKKQYDKYVPDEIKDDINSQVKNTRKKVSQALKEVMKKSQKDVKLLSSQSMADWKIPSANYSGIVPLGNDDYAVVDDKSPSGGFYVMHIELDTIKGKVLSVKRSSFKGVQEKSAEDCEDIVYLPQCQSVWIASEANQTISEYSMEGEKTGRQLEVPLMFSKDSIVPNQGFEALTYASDSNMFYTTTESALRIDGKAGDNQIPLRMICFDSTMSVCAQVPYLMEKPLLQSDVKYYAHGVSAMLALGSNQFLVMERELSVPKSYIGAKTSIRIFWIDLDDVEALDDVSQPLSRLPLDHFLPKTEICSFSTGLSVSKMNYANFEGMCLGPQLSNGHQTVILICDSQNGMGNGIYHLKDYIKVIIL